MLSSRRALQPGRLTFLVALAIVPLVACAESPIAPTDEEFVTETFSGVVVRQGQSTHLFDVVLQGRVDATMLSLAPLSTITLGAQLGTWDGVGCSVLVEIEIREGQTLSRSLMPVGQNCVSIIDTGNVSDATPITYQLEVVHP